MSTVLGRNVHLFIHLFVFYPFLHYEFLKCIPWQRLGWNWGKMTLPWTTVSFQTSGWIEGSMDVKSWNFLICIFLQLSCCKKLANNDGYILTVLSKVTTEFWKTSLVGFTLYQKQFWWEVISLMYRKLKVIKDFIVIASNVSHNMSCLQSGRLRTNVAVDWCLSTWHSWWTQTSFYWKEIFWEKQQHPNSYPAIYSWLQNISQYNK